MSAALSPDGSKGALVDLGERLFTFDVTSGEMTDTGLKGAWPVRYSANGEYVALRSSNSGSSEQLRVVAMPGLTSSENGQFAHIGHIQPRPDGSFLATAGVRESREDPGSLVGVQYQPQQGQVKELWKLRSRNVLDRTDFDPETSIGVSTDFRLVTHLVDLRTDTILLTIDNSANARLEMVSTSFRGFAKEYPFLTLLGFIILLGIVAVYFWARRRSGRAVG
jgi:hypothetical protein